MQQLYDAVSQNEATINDSADPMKYYMHVGAVLENPKTGEIEALYPGPGSPDGSTTGPGRRSPPRSARRSTAKSTWRSTTASRSAPRSSPTSWPLAVKQGMNVQTSTLDGYNNLWIPPDSDPTTFASTTQPASRSAGTSSHQRRRRARTGRTRRRRRMAASINTAYADLWHVVAGPNGQNVIELREVGRRGHPRLRPAEHEQPVGHRARPGVADRRRAGLDAGDHRRQRGLPRRPRDHLDHQERRADAPQYHHSPGVQRRTTRS